MTGTVASKFVDRVHRRLMVFRIIEQFGRGLLVGSIAAIALLAIGIWQSMPTEPILLLCLVLGGSLGCVLTVLHWPTRLTAATEADRQLRMEDLLTTALFSTTQPGDDFNRAVLAMADARCQSHKPSEVVLNQLGIRSWSGIGIAVAMAVTLAVIPLRPSRSEATDANVAVLSADSIGTSTSAETQQSHGAINSTVDPVSESASSNSMTTDLTSNQSGVGNDHADSTPGLGSNAGKGGGAARTKAASQQPIETANSASHNQNANGATAGGGGVGSATNATGEESATGIRNSAAHAPPAAPTWNGQEPSTLQGGSPTPDDQIPPEDRNLVREFFNKN